MTEERLIALQDFERILGYCFRDVALLDNALTHRSFVNENPSLACRDNERLEFLGDAVLGLCISDMVTARYPSYAEGQLSKLRASLVNEQSLAELAKSFRVGDYLLLGRGEEASGGRGKTSLLADTFEAVIAAVYLDCGFAGTRAFVRGLFASLLEEGLEESIYRDYKTAVQEIARNRFRETPQYVLIGQHGPDHDRIFEMKLVIPDVLSTFGRGKNKKEAEQRAAKKALEMLVGEEAGSKKSGSA